MLQTTWHRWRSPRPSTPKPPSADPATDPFAAVADLAGQLARATDAGTAHSLAVAIAEAADRLDAWPTCPSRVALCRSIQLLAPFLAVAPPRDAALLAGALRQLSHQLHRARS